MVFICLLGLWVLGFFLAGGGGVQLSTYFLIDKAILLFMTSLG